MLETRAFARHDRDGLTQLVNRHIAAVLPGGAVPVATLLSQMERDVAEVIVDPWVIDRRTVVAVDEDRIVGGAHLKRYGGDERVGVGYRDAGEICWLVFDPTMPAAGRAVLEAAFECLRSWTVRTWYADGNLPCLGVYGIPDAWPHIEALLTEAGFDDAGGQIEVVFAGDLAGVGEPGAPPLDGLELRRAVGPLGTSFDAWIDDARVGAFEVEDAYGIANAQLARWADEANHWVDPAFRGRGIGTWLFRTGCEWLRLAGKDRLLTYAIERRGEGASPMENSVERCIPYYGRFGLRPITRTRRGWSRPPS